MIEFVCSKRDTKHAVGEDVNFKKDINLKRHFTHLKTFKCIIYVPIRKKVCFEYAMDYFENT